MAMTGGTSALLKTGQLGTSSATVKLYAYYKSVQNMLKNTSTVTCGMYIVVSDGWDIGSWTDGGGSYCGATSNIFNGSIPANTTGTYWLVEDETFLVNHNPDGTGKATFYWKWGVNSTWGNMTTPSGSFTFTLPTIPKRSTITVANTFIEYETTINIARATSLFTHTLQYKLSNSSTFNTIVEKTEATSYKWKVPAAVYAAVPANATSTVVTVRCITYNGSTQMGTYDTTFTAITNAELCKPTLTPTVKDIGSVSTKVTGNSEIMIKDFNIMEYAFNETSWNGAIITSRKVTCGNKSATATTGSINYCNSNVFTFTVTDSRGFSTTAKVTKSNFVNYIGLSSNLIAAAEVASNNTATLRIKAEGNFFNGTIGKTTNYVKTQYRYKVDNGAFTAWTDFTPTITNNSYMSYQTITGLDYTATFTVETRAWDCLYDNGATEKLITKTKTISAAPVFDWGKNDFKVNVDLDIAKGLYGFDKSGNRLLTVQPCNENNNTVIAWGNYEHQLGDTNIYGNKAVNLIAREDINVKDPVDNALYSLLGMARAMTKSYALDTTGTTGGTNWTCNDFTAVLLGNNLRLYFDATRSAATGTGNIANEVVIKAKLKHDGKIKAMYNTSVVSGATGGVATFGIGNAANDGTYVTFELTIAANATAITQTTGGAVLPVIININNY